jgi:hypothetical protein
MKVCQTIKVSYFGKTDFKLASFVEQHQNVQVAIDMLEAWKQYENTSTVLK